MDYKFGQKKQWRRWVWNRIHARLAHMRIAPKDALCVYLPGPTDFDRPHALAKGFRDNNLIGVEKNNKTLIELRDQGILTVDSDFFDAVGAIASNRKIDVVFADMCCGFDAKICTNFIRMTAIPSLKNTTFVVNLMRGRDRATNELRQWFAPEGQAYDTCESAKHRGNGLAQFIICYWARVIHMPGQIIDMSENAKALRIRRYEFLTKWACPEIATYRSTSNQTFDSVVFFNPLTVAQPTNDETALVDRLQKEAWPVPEQAKRSAAAILATRTRRDKVNNRMH